LQRRNFGQRFDVAPVVARAHQLDGRGQLARAQLAQRRKVVADSVPPLFMIDRHALKKALIRRAVAHGA
jgi:hypothetical protein